MRSNSVYTASKRVHIDVEAFKAAYRESTSSLGVNLVPVRDVAARMAGGVETADLVLWLVTTAPRLLDVGVTGMTADTAMVKVRLPNELADAALRAVLIFAIGWLWIQAVGMLAE